jgi:outer membrane protein OmpA-like peptidoglycan-associated protein
LFSTVTSAQSKKYSWQFFSGINAVDTYPTGAAGSGAIFEEYLNVYNWNMAIYPSFIGVKKYVDAGFSFGTRFSLNKINQYGDLPASDNYYNVDGIVSYNIGDVLKSQRLKPFLELGGGYAFFDKIGAGYFNLGAGLEYWMGQKKKTGIVLETVYKNTGETFGNKHFQHLLGIAFLFGDVDIDNDGILNEEDECPEIPGLAIFKGCPDSDGDGIKDSEDDCPETPGLIEFNGCPDTDGDGVKDSEDDCPETPGLIEFNGCPDTDGDGIIDSEDDCPEVAGIPKFNGCPDTDGDGVMDSEDECPEEVGTIDNNGCPDLEEEKQIETQLDEISQKVYFEIEKSTILEDAKETLNELIDVLERYSHYNIEILGHADSTGPDQYNQVLSESRAKAVMYYLISKGVDPARLSFKGFGETQPAYSNSRREGRRLNRRVEFKIKRYN